MLSGIFYWILNMSIIAGIVGLPVMILRKIRAIPAFAKYILWALPLLRFWIPAGIASSYSMLNFISKYATKTVFIWPHARSVTFTNAIMAADSYFPVVYKSNELSVVFDIAALIWAIVACAAVMTALCLYFLTMAELKDPIPIGKNIYISDKITAPAVYGIIHPKIIIPAAMADADLTFIKAHETIHIKRRDNLIRAVFVITACIHWFNPLAWVFLKYFFEDMELACDAKLLKDADDAQKFHYADAVLSAAAQGRTLFSSAFGGAKVGIRIKSILTYKKLTLFSAVCFSVLLTATAVVLLTNAVA